MYTPFKVLRVLYAESLGTNHTYIEEVQCPDCQHIFTRKHSTGCFHHNVSPFTCPKCCYPYNMVLQKPKEEEYNPSKRIK